MKLLITLLALTSLSVLANNNKCIKTNSLSEDVETQEIKTDVPKFLEGATIIVRLADGTETKVPAEKFKVVPRKQQFLVTKVKSTDSVTCTEEVEKISRHRVSLAAGKGPSGKLKSDTSNLPNQVSIESEVGLLGAAQYQYKFDSGFSLGGQVQTNKSGLLLLGKDF